MIEPFLGTWKLESSEHFEEYLEQLGDRPHTTRPACSCAHLTCDDVRALAQREPGLAPARPSCFRDPEPTLLLCSQAALPPTIGGVPVTIRHLAALEKPTINISAHGDKVSIKTQTSFKNFEIVFKLGEEFDETTADNRKVKSILTLAGNSLVHVQKWLGKETTIKRQIVGGKMVATHTMNSVISTRVFTKV